MSKTLSRPGKVFVPAILCFISICAQGADGPAGTGARARESRIIGIPLPVPDRTITGKVTSENGTPLAGASVVVKGEKGGTATDENGNFSISVPDNTTTLVISYGGYLNQEVSVKGKSSISVGLT